MIKSNEYLENLVETWVGDAIKLTKEEAHVALAYSSSRETGYDELILDDIIWDKNKHAIFQEIQKSGVDKFVYACGFSGSIGVLTDMLKFGFKVRGSFEQEVKLEYRTETVKGILLDNIK